MYYRNLNSAPDWQRQRAAEQLAGYNLIEPPVFESLVAFSYRLIGSDPVWVARIFAALFWLIGGAALYSLAARMTSADGGVVALAYYLFVPFGVIASRSFQPDPLMVVFILLAAWAAYRWYRQPGWKGAILAGGLTGLAIFIKAVAVFPLAMGLAGLLLFGRGWRAAWRDPQVWLVAGLSILPAIAYHLYGVYVLGGLESQFEGRFFPEMWFDPAFYVRFLGSASGHAGFGAFLAGLLGVLLFPKPAERALVGGLWLGYFLYGMSFPYHIITHSYYHLPLLPVVGLSLAPLAALLFPTLLTWRPAWLGRVALMGLLLFAVVTKAWEARVELSRESFRHEPAYWQEIGEQLGHSPSVVALTHDYGNRLAYYGWITPQVWLPSGHLENYRRLRGGSPLVVRDWFAELTGNQDYFLVTLMNQLEKQPELKELLTQNYAVFAEGDGFIIFDLHRPLN
jgi:hypothetical protein